MFGFAAVCLDASQVVIQANKTKCIEDCHDSREQALDRVNAAIVGLLQTTTPYTLATQYHEILAQYVYLRRALQGSVGMLASLHAMNALESKPSGIRRVLLPATQPSATI